MDGARLQQLRDCCRDEDAFETVKALLFQEGVGPSLSEFQLFLENSDDIFVEYDRELRYVWINPVGAAIFGLLPFDAIGKTDAQLMGDRGEEMQFLVRQAFDTGQKVIVDREITFPAGTRIFNTVYVPIFDRGGQVHRVVGLGRDVTDLRRLQHEAYNAILEAQTRAQQQTLLAEELAATLERLRQTQSQLVQTEKMSSLGQLVAGVAHEINNPVNFIHGNLAHLESYTNGLLELVAAYRQDFPHGSTQIDEIGERIDLPFVMEDFPRILASLKLGTERIRHIVRSLRNFSRLDESDMKLVDIHEGIESTLLILQNRFKVKEKGSGIHSGIQLMKSYGPLPAIECFASQLNQVFMNILVNALDALEEYPPPSPQIAIRTEMLDSDRAVIRIADNGRGISPEVCRRLFEPFFTTKPVGKGTGLGLSVSYQIVTKTHGGMLECHSQPDRGTEFRIEIPIRQVLRPY